MNHANDESSERSWAKGRFRQYLLGKLDKAESERVSADVAVYPGLIDDLDDVESGLINEYLDRRLSPEESSQFESQYVHTDDLDNQGKLQLQKALRSKEVQALVGEPQPMRRPRPRLEILSLAVAAAAVIALVALGGLYYLQSRELATALAELRARQPRQGPQQNQQEQQAGQSSPEGLTLSARIAGTGTATVSAPPARLIWTPVPDYQQRYRFRIYSSEGGVITSPPLDARNNAIEYPLENPASHPLPWDVFVLTGDTATERAVAHYIVRKP